MKYLFFLCLSGLLFFSCAKKDIASSGSETIQVDVIATRHNDTAVVATSPIVSLKVN